MLGCLLHATRSPTGLQALHLLIWTVTYDKLLASLLPYSPFSNCIIDFHIMTEARGSVEHVHINISSLTGKKNQH